MTAAGFVCLHRGEDLDVLLKDRAAFTLLALIASRVRWREDQSIHGLRQGEAIIGCVDVQNRLGLSRKEYRGALVRLEKLGQVIVVPKKGVGTVVGLGANCVFSYKVRKRATQLDRKRATLVADDSSSENAELVANKKANLWANQVAKDGPIRNKETRVQSPGPKSPGFGSGPSAKEREAHSLSVFHDLVNQVKAMPEFSRRADIEEIAKICSPIRNAAHLARLVRDERRPRYILETRALLDSDQEPDWPWRDYLTATDDWRKEYADRPWAAIPITLRASLSRRTTDAA